MQRNRPRKTQRPSRLRWDVLERHGITPTFLRAFAALLAALLVLPLLFWAFEHRKDPDVRAPPSAFIWLWRTLTEQASPYPVRTIGGEIVYNVVLLVGVGIIAVATAAIVSNLIRRTRGMGETRMSGHVLICGWNAKGAGIVAELTSDEGGRHPVAILADLEQTPEGSGGAVFVHGDPSHRADLERAGLQRAATAVVLADDARGPRDPRDVDGKTLLTTLAVEATNPTCYTCVEVLLPEDVEHFARTNADELIVSGEVTGLLLASAASDHGMSRVVSDLLTRNRERGPDNMLTIDVPPSMVGKSFLDVLMEVKVGWGATVVAIARGRADIEVNPGGDRTLAEGERLVLIADGPVNLRASAPRHPTEPAQN
jgi:voltage-gated potassium channel